ncbi:unnamed protein product [Prorocentrum cordatum]|uniref:Uncharacterized protein n=1 Tax=Prorocentrum cordatum TaxID=2364126 RepID=A0ABN9YGA7_9DINO|nr:unnamed protein product [Polarella glacialis]
MSWREFVWPGADSSRFLTGLFIGDAETVMGIWVPNAEAMAQGAKCRVHRWENIKHGGLRLDRRARRLQRARLSSDHLQRLCTWAPWFDGNFISTVLETPRRLETVATIQGFSVDLVFAWGSAEGLGVPLDKPLSEVPVYVEQLEGLVKAKRAYAGFNHSFVVADMPYKSIV